MKLSQLEYFLEVANTGSMTKAAKKLYVSQPSLSKSIASLESHYNKKIFTRTPQGVQLTTEGKELLFYAKRISSALKTMDEVFKGETESKKLLSITTQQFDFLNEMLIEIYNQNLDHSLEFNVVEANRSQVIQNVLSGEINIGIIVRSTNDSKFFSQMLLERNLEVTVINTSPVYVNMGEKSPLYHKEIITLSNLGNLNFAVLDMEDQAVQDLYLLQTNNLVTNENILFFNSINVCIQFLLHTDVHLYTPKWLLKFFEGTNIRSVPLTLENEEKVLVNELVLIKRKNDSLSEIEEQFIENLRQYFV